MRVVNSFFVVIQILVAATCCGVQGFSSLSALPFSANIIVTSNVVATMAFDRAPTDRYNICRRQHNFSLHQSRHQDIDGTNDRGPILLVLSLVLVIWLFSIPPEFRRARICTLPVCVENRAACNDCKTTTELREGIVEYYRNGGGIQFDFSIDPATIEQNKQTLQKFGL
jgi:hypothetical protein